MKLFDAKLYLLTLVKEKYLVVVTVAMLRRMRRIFYYRVTETLALNIPLQLANSYAVKRKSN